VTAWGPTEGRGVRYSAIVTANRWRIYHLEASNLVHTEGIQSAGGGLAVSESALILRPVVVSQSPKIYIARL
jgi:hypothetical protein